MIRWAPVIVFVGACQAEPPPLPEASAAPETEARSVTVDPALRETGRIATSRAERHAAADDLVVTGHVVAKPDAAARLSANLPARLKRIHVEEGDEVEADQVLAELATPAVARLSADLASARAKRKQAEGILEQERRLLEGAATSRRALLRAESELARVRAEETAAGRLLAAAGRGKGGIVVRSPIAGVVTHRAAILGAKVSPDDVLFHVVDPAGLYVLAHVPASVATTVDAGTEVTVQPPGATDACAGQIDKSIATAEHRGRSIGFRTRLDDGTSCAGLVAGGYVDVTLHRASAGDAKTIAVSRDAVVELDGVPTVFLTTDEPGRYAMQTVRIASFGAHTAYLEDGLDAGAEVVSRGAILLKGEWMRSSLE